MAAPHFYLNRRNDNTSYSGLVPLLAGLFGAIIFISLAGLLWCCLRRRKHRAPVIPYHLHTINTPRTDRNPPAVCTGEMEGRTQVEARQNRDSRRKSKKPSPLGQEGRGVGYGFNPVFEEAYGGGGGGESGLDGVSAQRVGPMWG